MNKEANDSNTPGIVRVDRPVRPRYWMTRASEYRLKNGWSSKGAVPVHAKPSVTANIPLYGIAELDAAVAAERERCAKLAETYKDPCDGEDAEHDTALVARCIASRIREA